MRGLGLIIERYQCVAIAADPIVSVTGLQAVPRNLTLSPAVFKQGPRIVESFPYIACMFVPAKQPFSSETGQRGGVMEQEVFTKKGDQRVASSAGFEVEWEVRRP